MPSCRVARTCLPEMKTGFSSAMVLHQIDAADRLVVGGEAHIQRFDLQIAGQVVEDLLRVEITPDRRTVVIGRVGVLTSYDNVRKTEVLSIGWRA